MFDVVQFVFIHSRLAAVENAPQKREDFKNRKKIQMKNQFSSRNFFNNRWTPLNDSRQGKSAADQCFADFHFQ